MNIKYFLLIILATGFFATALSQEENTSNPANVNGLRISGGLSGLGESFTSELEPRLKQDVLFYSSQYNLDWNRYKKTNYLNPLGISYGENFGIGTLFGFFETRGISGSQSVTGFYPRYRYMSLGFPSGTNTINDNAMELSITEGGLGYQFKFDKLLITPKVSGRYFHRNFAQNTLYFGNLIGLGFYDLRVNSSAFYLGTKLQYLFTESSSIFMDGSTNTFTPINGNETGSLHQITALTTNVLIYTSATLSQQITSSRLLAGYQQNFGPLGIIFGYQQESISTNYTKFTSLPVSIIGNDFKINTTQYILDRFVIYKNQMNTEIKSFYISLVYAY